MSSNTILVVGGGFSGITAALEAAEVGYEVFIVEKNPYLGGRVLQLNQYFPKLCPPSCGMEINFQRIKKNPRVHVLTMAEVVSVNGGPGKYDVKVKVNPRYINEKCTCCGDCATACAATRTCDFDLGLGESKAVYQPNLFAFPMRYVLDKEKCTESDLAKIKEACKYDAVDLADKEKTVDLNVGTIVWATGWKPYDLSKLTNLGGGTIKNAISNMQMERLASPSGPTNGFIVRPSDGKAPKKIAFVQCAGSRDQNHLNYCSYICCMASLKQCTYLRAQYPDADITIYYIDIRTPGRYEKFYKKVQADPKITFIKGKVAGLAEDAATGDVLATVENAVDGIKGVERYDLVVLATGMQPSVAGTAMPFKAPQDEEGFVIGGAEIGLFAAGCAGKPLDVTRSAQNATGAALKAIQTVVGGK